MKIGVISDIHDNIPNLTTAFSIFNQEKIKKLLFCGDLASPATIIYFNKISIPVLAVFGNIEYDKKETLNLITKHNLNVDYPNNSSWELDFEQHKIALFHGHKPEVVNNLIRSQVFEFVFTGHTHEKFKKIVGKTIWVNPGPLCGYVGLNHKPTPATIAVADLQTKEVKFINIP